MGKKDKSTEKKNKKMLEASGLLKIIANPVRLRILCELENKKLPVNELHEIVSGISQPAISQHLSVLKAHKILQDEKIGQQVFYSIKDDKAIMLITAMRDIFCKD